MSFQPRAGIFGRGVGEAAATLIQLSPSGSNGNILLEAVLDDLCSKKKYATSITMVIGLPNPPN